MFEKWLPPASPLVTADLGPAWCNYFKEQHCGIDTAFLQNLGWLKIRLFCKIYRFKIISEINEIESLSNTPYKDKFCKD